MVKPRTLFLDISELEVSMNQVFPILILIIISGICLVALFLTLNAYFGRILERAKGVATERANRSFLTGLVNGLFLTAVVLAVLALGQNTGGEVLFVLAFLIGLVLLLGVIFGTTVMVLVLKERLFPGQLGNRPLIYASSIGTLACLTPYIGWFGLFPYMIFRGMGAFVITLVEIRRENRQARAAEEGEDV
jgi:hypothetical protein